MAKDIKKAASADSKRSAGEIGGRRQESAYRRKRGRSAKKDKVKLKSPRPSHILNDRLPFNIKEAYKSARTNIIFALREEKVKRILVTSSFPKEGKTTTCVNLGIAFGQMGSRVLVIEADLRKPRMHQIFSTVHGVGLTDVLSGVCSLEDALFHAPYENLDILQAGHLPPNPAEMLSSSAMERLLDVVSGMYEYVFIDTPPVNIVTDAATLAPRAAGVFLVVRVGVTDHIMVREALNRLKFANVKPLGFILNDVEGGRSYKYGRYSPKSYSSGYGLEDDEN